MDGRILETFETQSAMQATESDERYPRSTVFNVFEGVLLQTSFSF